MRTLNPRFWARKRVCVTGGTGFLGWQLVRQLLPLTRHVRILGLPPASRSLMKQLQTHDCVFADVRDAEAVGFALRDCDVVFHTAGPVAVWGPALPHMRDIHVVGTQQVLRALRAGARLVHTSSVVTVGASPGAEILTETSRFNLQRLRVDYVHAKKAAEEVALDAAGRGVDVVVVNPGYLIGPEDENESVMGRFCLRFWRGNVPLIPPGGLNFVDVRDVARGHLLAAEHGRRGVRYILGGENRLMSEFAACLAEVGGMAPRRRISLPALVQSALACLAECRAALVRREPYPSRQAARLSRFCWYYSSRRAHTELGYDARPMRDSLADALRWLSTHGWLKAYKKREESLRVG
jgi:dihydroflavonol-4-reductase